ncbi:hypothetical protein WN51_08354 [Melipona quadrifasciata]|uniref:Osiris 10 n=1 Tax=Melipona quadrifasciata TaxID=166423 RepID=A0A0M9A9V4_9HYME|nr:hypothetical protein WN51_08354 [Melipona quadrifasciata]
MKHGLRGLCLLAFVSTGITVIMEPTEESISSNEDSTSFDEAFGACLARKEFGTLECANRGALSALQSLDHKDDLDFGNVHLERANGQSRELLDWDYDAKDFGNVVKATTKLIERRSFKWNLDSVYPGLQLQAGPTLNGNGIMEFVINERATTFGDRQAGPGRQMVRRLLLPFLLGFKFSLASLIPLLFGFLLILTKKALLLTKIALVISGLLGWNSLLSPSGPSHYPAGGFHTHGHETPIGGFPYYEHYNFHQRPYKGFQGNDFQPYSQHVIREVVDVYDNADEVGRSKRNGKNFVWVKSN